MVQRYEQKRRLQWYKRGAAYSLAVYRLRGDCKSPGFIGRTFFLQRIANPLGRLTEDRRLTESVRNPWSKNALLTQRNPMKKYPGEGWVKGGEG